MSLFLCYQPLLLLGCIYFKGKRWTIGGEQPEGITHTKPGSKFKMDSASERKYMGFLLEGSDQQTHLSEAVAGVRVAGRTRTAHEDRVPDDADVSG